MNQILSVENTKKEKRRKSSNAPIEIQKIVTIFAIIMIIFGVALIGSGSYAMYKGKSSTPKSATRPIIVVTQTAGTQVTIQITHDKPLSKVTYKWNDEEAIEIETNSKSEISQIIEIPSGNNNKLSIFVEDINEQTATNESMYTAQRNIDVQLEANGTDLKVSIESEKELAYMTYRWDDEEEQEVELSGNQAEETIEIPKGLHTLTLIVVDIENNTQTEEQEIKAVTKPKLNITVDQAGENFIIKASDEEGVKRIEFTINADSENAERNSLDLDKVFPIEERKEFEYAYPLREGDNNLIIRAYNESGVYEEARVMFRK